MRYLCLLLFSLGSTVCLAAPVQIQGVRIWAGPATTRIVFDASAPVRYQLSTKPQQLELLLPGADFATVLPAFNVQQAYVTQITQRPSAEGVHLVLALKDGVTAKSFVLGPNQQYGHRLVVDLSAQDAPSRPPTPASLAAPTAAPAQPAPLVLAAADPATPLAPPPTPPQVREIVIAIDAEEELTDENKKNAQDLLDIYQLASQGDPQLKAAEAARLAILETKPQSRALLFPSIDLSADISANRQDIQLPFDSPGVTYFKSSGYALNLVQPVYNQSTLSALRQADVRIGQADAEYGVAQQELIVRTSARYFDVLAALDNLKFARAEKNAIARQLEQNVQRFEVGLIAVTDINEAQARYDLTLAEEIAAQNQLATSREALREVTGQYHENLAPLIDQIPLVSPEPTDIEKWAETALKQNLQINAADFAAQVARAEIDRQRAAGYPKLDIVGSHAFSDSGGGRFGGAEILGSSIGLQLTAPLYKGGLITSRTREAQHRHTQAREFLEQQQRAVLRQTRAAYLGVLANISRVNALQQAVVSSQSALDATQAGLEVGTRTAVDALDTQRDLFRAKRDYARVRYDYVLETLRLKQAAGILSQSDLEQINAWLK